MYVTPHNSTRPVNAEDVGRSDHFSRSSGQSARWSAVLDIINASAHITMGAVAYSAYLFANLYVQVAYALSLHIYFCVMGYVILMGLAVLSMSPHTGWARNLDCRQRRRFHTALHLLGSIFVIVGSAIKMADQGAIFTSIHASLGIVALIFTVLSLIGGVLNYLKIVPRIIRVLHFVSGTMTITISFMTLTFAFHAYYRPVFGTNSTIILLCFTTYAWICILMYSLVKYLKKM